MLTSPNNPKYPNPWSIQIELTEGCNRRCRFCGIHSLYREKIDEKYKFMTIETGDLISKDLGQWLPKVRIEFALQGEPLLNPHHNEIINRFRSNFPKCQLMMTSNTDVLRKGNNFNTSKLYKLFQSGLNIYVADYYGESSDPSYTDFYQALEKSALELGIPILDFYKDKPVVWGYESHQQAKIVVIDNTLDRNIFRTMNNQAGNLNPHFYPDINFKERIKKRTMTRCPLPFRELVIKYDGAVPLCCMDWQRDAVVGKFPDKSFKDIWIDSQLAIARKILFNKRRDLLFPCSVCDYRGLKNGLVRTEDDLEESELIELSQNFRKQQKINAEKYGNRYKFNAMILT